MNKVDQINRLLLQATHHRDQLTMIAKEFVDLHNEAHGSCEADELFACILDGQPYDEALHRIRKIQTRNR